MPTRIRLQRVGKKNHAFYHIVIADGRAPRDGKFIEKIGTYNPNTNPASIELDVDKAVQWLQNGAQPSDTCRRILSYKGALLKNHLATGVRKGAINQETADARFNEWLQAKEAKISGIRSTVENEKRDAKKNALEQERKVNEAKAAAVAAKRKAAEEAEAAARAAEEAAAAESQATVEDATTEATASDNDAPAAE